MAPRQMNVAFELILGCFLLILCPVASLPVCGPMTKRVNGSTELELKPCHVALFAAEGLCLVIVIVAWVMLSKPNRAV